MSDYTLDPNRILLAGDVHGDLHQMKYLFGQATDYACWAIVVLGDFGYWEHTPSGIHFLDYIADRHQATGVRVFFIDGNHENHSLLRWRYMGLRDSENVPNDESTKLQAEVLERKLGPYTPAPTSDGFWPVRAGLYYIPRGTVWQWGDVRFGALGGAYSIDINYRKPSTSWWPQEMVTDEEVERFKDVGKLDVLLTHDAPIEIDMQLQFVLQRMGAGFMKADNSTVQNRKRISSAVAYTMPDKLFHGHYHLDYTSQYTTLDNHIVAVRGLNRDGFGKESFTVLDLKENDDRRIS